MSAPRSAAAKGGQRRRRARPLWRRRSTRAAGAILLLLVTIASGWWSWREGWIADAASDLRRQMIALTTDMGLTVAEILVIGRDHASRDALLKAIGHGRGAPILNLDPDATRRRIEALPWVRVAAVERLLPDTIVVRIRERQPMAVWQNQGRFALIDRQGTVIEDRRLDRFPDLLVVVGADAPGNASGLLDVLRTEVGLMTRVKAAVRVGGRRWNLRLDNGMDVHLPEVGAASAWARLAQYERTHKVLARDVEVLDLRLPDRVIVRRHQGSGKEGRKGGRET